ncbi:MAG TPA: protein phosphatase 2C domain-containing protein [Gammaproteobacteria bacterium]|jgi:serine/threonine protein phosphatase PrpC
MKVDAAELSLLGNRKENQDRVGTILADGSMLLIVADGMGGHSQGATAAQVTIDTLRSCFVATRKPLLDPQGFLTMALSTAHDRVVGLGTQLALDHRPRATCAVCLVQDGGSFWAHIGDSRIYHVRGGEVIERTRDHSHVELLLREGLIEEQQISNHPMRNLVECCLGGDAPLPGMHISAQRKLRPGDALLVCTDGLWSGVSDEQIAMAAGDLNRPLNDALHALGEQALGGNAPHSDNASVVGLRWLDGIA